MSDFSYHAQLTLKTRVLNVLRRPFQLVLLERLLRRLTLGRSARSIWARFVPPEYTYKADSWREVNIDGALLRLDISNVTDHDAYFGFTDTSMSKFFSLIQAHFNIVDVGGNIGIQALNFARLVPQGVVVSFEPDPDTFRRLNEHAMLNPHFNIVVRNIGIGPERQDLSLFRVVPNNNGMNRLLADQDNPHAYPSVQVRVEPLNAALIGTGIARVDAIKIDVEGYEVGVLNGSMPIILRDRPILFVEVDDENLRKQGSCAQALIVLLESMNYSVVDARDSRTVSPNDEFRGCHFDVLCTPRG